LFYVMEGSFENGECDRPGRSSWRPGGWLSAAAQTKAVRQIVNEILA
jgi:hypothetical protein